MKVLLVNKFHYMKGGSERYYFSLADALRKNGHEVHFFAMQDEKNYPCDDSKYFVSNVSVNGGLTNKIKYILNMDYSKEAYHKMDELLNNINIDVAILNLVHKQITLSIINALKKHNVKIIWTMHDLITVCPSYTMLDGKQQICEKCLDGNFKHCLENKCIKNSTLMSYLSMREANYIKKKKFYYDVDCYICPSEFYREKLIEGKFTNSPIVYLPNLLPEETEYSLNLDNDNYILYFGRLSKEKGVETLINVIGQTKYKLYIVGTGPIADDLKNIVKEKELTNIEFKGFKQGKELTDFVKHSKVVVLPSEWYENGPYSAMEAMALGKPLIVSDKGGLPELIDGNGYIYKNEDELKSSVDKVMNLNQNEYQQLCEKSLMIAKNKFNPDKYIDKLMKLIEEIKK